MDELFDIPESLSPRLRWMRTHGITTNYDEAQEGEEWMAYCKPTSDCAFASDEETALVLLAKELGITLWNEL